MWNNQGESMERTNEMRWRFMGTTVKLQKEGSLGYEKLLVFTTELKKARTPMEYKKANKSM